MKTTMEFNLPEDDEKLINAIKGKDYASALFNYNAYLKNRIEQSEDEYDVSFLVGLKKDFNSILDDYNIKAEDL